MIISFPELTGKRWRGLVLSAGLATFVRIMLQPLIPEAESVLEPSVIVEAGLLIPVFTVYAFLVYLFMGYSFAMLEARLPYSKMGKGLVFASCLGAIWLAYLFEPVPLGEGAALMDLLAYPLADGISVLVLGLLLGRYVSSEKQSTSEEGNDGRPIIILLPLVLLVVRSFEYNVLDIYSSYGPRPIDTMLWVAALGAIIALSYVFLRKGVPSADPGGRSLAFGLFFYGIPIFMVNAFVGIALKIDWGDMVLRSSLDIVSVLISIFIIERYMARGKGPAA